MQYLKTMFRFCLGAVLGLQLAQAGAAMPPAAHVSTGSLEAIAIHSAYVQDRPVQVWLPDGYAERARAGHRFQVLYMHDGQMLFDPATTWNKQAWEVDDILGRLIREGRVPDTIVVGIFNNDKYRGAEYFPQKFLDLMPAAPRESYLRSALLGKAQADNYLRFLVTELKPLVDRRYATVADASGTFIMGSSMGGLISVYALCEYPQVFGGAAGLSTHWPGTMEHNAAIPLAAYNYLQQHLPAPQGHRLYLDHGTATLDALYAPYQSFIDMIVREHGYTDASYMSRVFEGANHSEQAWTARLELPLVFLLGKK